MRLKFLSPSTYIHHKKKNNNRKTKNLNWPIVPRIHLNYYRSYLHIPFSWNLVILHTGLVSKLYMYSNTYFICISVPKTYTNYHFDSNTGVVGFTNLYENNYKHLYFDNIKRLLSLCNNPCFLKIKFKGKGYYIYKNKRSTITPQFGFAHRHYIYAFYTSVNFRTKTSIMLYGMSLTDLHTLGLQIKSLRPINIFTGRGVRFNKQIIYKKTGKVSSYR